MSSDRTSEYQAQALRNFQDGLAAAEVNFLEVFGGYIENLARSRCRAHHLLEQDVEEVSQETLRLLLDPSVVRFADASCSAKCYIGGHAFNAARIVATAYRNGPASGGLVATTARVELAAAEGLEGTQNGIADAEFRLLLGGITKGCDATSRKILSAIHLEEATIVDVAERLQLTRFQVHRRLRTAYSLARLILAA